MASFFPITGTISQIEPMPSSANNWCGCSLLVSISTAYEVMHEPGFPVLRVGSRMVVPKEKFIQWAEEQSGGAK